MKGKAAHGIRTEREGDIARVTIDHAAKANSLDTRLLDELVAAFAALGRDPLPRAVVLTGAGDRAFVGGASLDEMAALDAAGAEAFIRRVHAACEAVRRCPVPVVARINGVALGAGLELAAACDLRIASATAAFGMPEVRFGIPSVVEAVLLPRFVGRGRAAWLLLTGQTVDAQTALRWGLVERVVPASALDATVDETLAALRAMDPGAVRTQKALLAFWDERPFDEGIDESIAAFRRSYADGTPKRLMGDFLEARQKRKKPA
ncbi:MAG TPA: enoyl-CoA hydratase [Burkholderiales bacterium]